MNYDALISAAEYYSSKDEDFQESEVKVSNPKKTVAVNIGENEIAIVQERAARLDISFSAALRLIIQEWAAFLVNQPASPEAN